MFDFLFRHQHKEDACGRRTEKAGASEGIPAVRGSVCTGEAVGGYIRDGRFHDTELLASERDFDEFARKKHTDRNKIKIIYE